AVTTAATCEADGVLTYTCSHDKQHTYTESIPALGHDMQIKQHLAPTKEATGFQVRICSRCELTKNTVLPKLDADLGDLNGDGVRNSKDVTSTRRYLAGGYSIALANELIADVNKDGVVNAKDVTILRRFLAGGYGVVLD
ncbi:MAG: dockerin type I repeat-containing protein, partial [Oscillospiraceae bacterium]|nr:dockerin type I repeat-containing protein [Oscillospiraceae bacterium]